MCCPGRVARKHPEQDYGQAVCLLLLSLAMALADLPFWLDTALHLFSDSLSPAIDHASSHTSTPILPRPMISTTGHRTCINTRFV
jgi:hypothetical protein